VKVTGKPELAVAAELKFTVVPWVCVGIVLKVIVWVPSTVKL